MAAGLLPTGAVPHAALAEPAPASVLVGNATGAPGGRADVTVSLTGGGPDAATMQVDIVFDATVLAIDPVTDCTKAVRLTNSTLDATLPSSPPVGPGQQRLLVRILDLQFPIEPIGDGELLTCSFRVNPGAPLGIVALRAEGQSVGSTSGTVLPSAATSGAIEIVAALTPTVAPPTDTPVATSTAAPTNTQAPTHTPTAQAPTPTATRRFGGGGGGCAVVSAPSVSPGAAWVLALCAALMMWKRRRV
jgi:hypothetical protein